METADESATGSVFLFSGTERVRSARSGRGRRLPLQLRQVTTPAAPDTVHARLLALLRAGAAEFELTRHDPVTTSAEAAAVRGAALRSGAKAMLVKTRAGLVLAVLPGDRKVDWKLLAPLVGGKGARFATDEELREATGLSKGAVPPLGALFGLRTIYDAGLLEVEVVNFNAGTQTESVAMARDDLIRIGAERWRRSRRPDRPASPPRAAGGGGRRVGKPAAASPSTPAPDPLARPRYPRGCR